MTARYSGILVNLGLGVALAGGIVYSSQLVTRSLERIRGTIEVKGYAERKMKADYATWSIGVKARGTTLSHTYAELERNKTTVLKYLNDADIKDAAFEVGSIVKSERYKRDQYGNPIGDVEGFEVIQPINIKSPDIEKVKALAPKISDLGAQGIEIDANVPSYLLLREKLEKTKIELLAESTKSAKERADQFAHNSHTTIGRLVSARQGVFQVTAEDSTDVSDYGTYDTSSINKVVKLVVTLSYTTGE